MDDNRYVFGFDPGDGRGSLQAWCLMRRDSDGTITLVANGTGDITEAEAQRLADEAEAVDRADPCVGVPYRATVDASVYGHAYPITV